MTIEQIEAQTDAVVAALELSPTDAALLAEYDRLIELAIATPAPFKDKIVYKRFGTLAR